MALLEGIKAGVMGDKEPEGRRRSRAAEPLREHLSKRLAEYAVVTGAAAAGLLVAAAPAKADVIYTPADITFKTGSSLYLDLNHDGTNDFLFVNQADLGLGSTTFLIPQGLRAGNAILEGGPFKSALALPFGAEIGPSARFSGSGTMAFAYHASLGGAWGHAENRYLGLEFLLNSQEHFGWAELTVDQEHHGRTTFGIQATLEGYAYDTVPNQAIVAGETSSTPEPGTLGLLALGSLGLGLWRRKKQESEV
jgi:PEP-CTERM motif